MRQRLEAEGWDTQVVSKGEHGSADDMLWAALHAIEEQRPDGVILDVRLGDYRDDQFKGLDILKRIVVQHPQLPVLMFTQYSQGVERDAVARSALQVNWCLLAILDAEAGEPGPSRSVDGHLTDGPMGP